MKDIVFLIPLVLCACGNNKNQIAVSHNNMTSFDSDTLWIDEPDNTPTCHYDPILRKWFGPGSDEMNGTKYEYYDEDVTGFEIRFGLWGADLTRYFNKERIKECAEIADIWSEAVVCIGFSFVKTSFAMSS